jgi:hypothetical protein
MSIPAGPPSDQPPLNPTGRSIRARLWGALAATVFVGLGLSSGIGEWLTVLVLGPFVALFGVFVGSVLTAFKRTREFAVGFLGASAILIFVTFGACVALIQVLQL